MKYRDTSGREILTSQAALDIGMFGDGSDGVANFDGSATPSGATKNSSTLYTLNRSVFYTDMTVASGVTVKTAGYKIYCNRILLINSTAVISNVGNTGGTGASGGGGSAVGGTPGPALAAVELGGSSAGATGGAGSTGAGNAGIAGASASISMGATAGGGGIGGTGTGSGGVGGGGAGGGISSSRPLRAVTHHLLSGTALITGGAGAGSGGAALVMAQ